jgi:hypothetical protein
MLMKLFESFKQLRFLKVVSHFRVRVSDLWALKLPCK